MSMRVTMADGCYYSIRLGRGCARQVCDLRSADGEKIGYVAVVCGQRVMITTDKRIAKKALAA